MVKVAGIGVGGRATIFNTLSERISRKLRFDFYAAIMRQDMAFFDEHHSGKLSKLHSKNSYKQILIVSNMSSDIQIIQSALGSNFSIYLRSAVSILVVLTIMCYISLTLTGVTLVTVIILTIISRIFMTFTTRLQKKIQAAKEEMT